jgi:hypothetical protein
MIIIGLYQIKKFSLYSSLYFLCIGVSLLCPSGIVFILRTFFDIIKTTDLMELQL